MILKRLLVLSCLSILAPAGLGQASRGASGKSFGVAMRLTALAVRGASRLSTQEVLAGTGLSVGNMVTEDDLKKTVARLGETGEFSEVLYSYSTSSSGVKVEFQVKENSELVPARFENLVWWPMAEIQKQLEQRVPFFHGSVPISGGMLDQVADALQAMVAERGVAGHVDYLRTETANKLAAVIYSVTAVDIEIRNVSFPGAALEDVPLLQKAGKQIPGGEYTVSRLAVLTSKDLMAVYRRRGYLKAAFGDPEPTLVSGEGQSFTVDVSLPVTPGAQYKLKSMAVTGNQAFPAAELQKHLHLPVGQPLNSLQLDEDIQAMRELYGSRGYLSPLIRPEAEFDDAANTVSYRIAIQEGAVYHFTELSIDGLDATTEARLTNAWALRPGEVYDRSYPQRFVDQNATMLPLGGRVTFSVHEEVDEKAKTVGVTLHFGTAPAR